MRKPGWRGTISPSPDCCVQSGLAAGEVCHHLPAVLNIELCSEAPQGMKVKIRAAGEIVKLKNVEDRFNLDIFGSVLIVFIESNFLLLVDQSFKRICAFDV